MVGSAASPAPAVRRALRVGVTGHRRVPPARRATIEESVRAVLEQIREIVLESPPSVGCDSSQPPLLRILSSLAEGADQLVATVALSLGYDLQCPLPFPVESYLEDFAPGSEARRDFEHLLEKASSVLELDGVRVPSEARHAAYEAAGRVMLAQSDLVIAIWDGEPAAGRGGTGQIVKEALESGMPVVVVGPDAPRKPILRIGTTEEESTPADRDVLGAQIRAILPPSGLTEAGATVSSGVSEGDKARTEHGRAQRAAYDVYLGERPPDARFLRRVGFVRVLEILWGTFVPTLKPGPEERLEGATHVEAGDGASRQAVADVRSSIDPHRAWSSGLARYYATLYRGSFLLNYFLGALAVTLALLAYPIPSLALPLAVLELVCIGGIITVVWRGRKGQWHQRAIHYRILAEQLRLHRILAPLGLTVPYSRPPAHLRDEGDLHATWMNRHFRAILRATGLVNVRCDSSYREARQRELATDWVRDQRRYHAQNALRMETARRRLGRWVFWAFYGAALACSAHILIALLSPGSGLHHVSPWLTVLAAGLPAWGAAFHGMSIQAECERLARRSTSMARRLTELEEEIRSAGAGAPDPGLRHLWVPAQMAAGEMLAEVADWQVLYAIHQIPMP